MPGEGLTHGPPAERKQAAVTTGSAAHPASPARWASRLYALSSVCRLVATVAFGDHHPQRLSASVGAPGPRDFTSASCRSSACIEHAAAPRGHRLPTSRVVTIAKRPSCRGGMAILNHEFGKKERRIFPDATRDGRCRRVHLHKIGRRAGTAVTIERGSVARSLVSRVLAPGPSRPSGRPEPFCGACRSSRSAQPSTW